MKNEEDEMSKTVLFVAVEVTEDETEDLKSSLCNFMASRLEGENGDACTVDAITVYDTVSELAKTWPKSTPNESENPRRHMAEVVANRADYNPEFDEESLLAEIMLGGGGDKDILRYLMMATEDAGDGADIALFFSNRAKARETMSEYARSGWVSFLFDLDNDGECIADRGPR